MANDSGAAGEKGSNPSAPAAEQSIVEQGQEEDIAEGMDRMMDEGGGVVEHHASEDAPVSRNDLVQPPGV